MTGILEIWKKRGKILEGIKNSVFTKQHVEEIALKRKAICDSCPNLDTAGDTCFIPGSQPCCSLCGCKLSFKQRALSDRCDEGRWDSILSDQEEEALNTALNIKEEDL